MTLPAPVLSAAEVEALTQRRRPSAQARVLDALQIPYRKRPDGSIVVFRGFFGSEPVAAAVQPQLRLPPRPALRIAVGKTKARSRR